MLKSYILDCTLPLPAEVPRNVVEQITQKIELLKQKFADAVQHIKRTKLQSVYDAIGRLQDFSGNEFHTHVRLFVQNRTITMPNYEFDTNYVYNVIEHW